MVVGVGVSAGGVEGAALSTVDVFETRPRPLYRSLRGYWCRTLSIVQGGRGSAQGFSGVFLCASNITVHPHRGIFHKIVEQQLGAVEERKLYAQIAKWTHKRELSGRLACHNNASK